MQYDLISDVPEEIVEFYKEVVESELSGNFVDKEVTTVDENGKDQKSTVKVPEYVDVTYVRLMDRPETKTQKDLDRVISLGKPQSVVDKFTAMVNVGISWDWFDEYTKYLEDKAGWDILEAPEEFGEDGEPIVFTKPDEQVKPTRKPSVYNTYSRTLFKADREFKVKALKVTIDGMVFDADEVSQGRIAIRIASLESDDSTTRWALSDNSVALVQKSQLKRVLVVAGGLFDSLWFMA